MRCQGPVLHCYLSANPSSSLGLPPCLGPIPEIHCATSVGRGFPGTPSLCLGLQMWGLLVPSSVSPLPTAAIYQPTWPGKAQEAGPEPLRTRGHLWNSDPFSGSWRSRRGSYMYFSLNRTPSLSLILPWS